MLIYFFIFFIIGILMYGVIFYNKTVSLNNLVAEAWSGIDVLLKQRYDLIPNLLTIVKGYAKHENDLFSEIAKLRSSAINAKSIKEKGESEAKLQDNLKSLFALAEAYPELKANKNFLELQNTLTKIEDQIQYARRYYNGTVRNLNIYTSIFPNNITAKLMNLKQKEFFQTGEEEKKSIKI